MQLMEPASAFAMDPEPIGVHCCACSIIPYAMWPRAAHEKFCVYAVHVMEMIRQPLSKHALASACTAAGPRKERQVRLACNHHPPASPGMKLHASTRFPEVTFCT